ncbi:putative nuclease HARBI1 [Temnothorax nylanderi]|uniref:putative nuclease HARBI1 n=1 Tax=Temnothorax nylanderi TaxID=102681 RepID=UPI003A8A1ABE
MHFRMKPSTFEYILNEIGDKLCRTSDGNEMIPANKQFLLSLWRFATPDSYRSIIERFGVGKATGVRAVRRVAKALCELSPRYITWPTENKIQDIIYNFSRPSGFPNVIGAIDGSHINIPAPTENPEAYVNRKGRHSIHLQAVCDHARLFTHIYVGNVGSVHDARVFRLSSLQEYINDANKFPNDTHIIGDAAYTLHQHLLVPYVDNGHLTQQQKNYNFCHSSARMVIERAFALLKGRWRSLLHVLAVNDIEFVPYDILACCVLHNICLLQKDELELEEIFIVDREEVILREERINDNNRYIAELKRNNICANLRMRNA